MKFDPTKLADASLNQLTTALIDQLGPLIDNAAIAAAGLAGPVRAAMSIAEQLDGRVRGRALPER